MHQHVQSKIVHLQQEGSDKIFYCGFACHQRPQGHRGNACPREPEVQTMHPYLESSLTDPTKRRKATYLVVIALLESNLTGL